MPIFEYKCAACDAVREILCLREPRVATAPCKCGAQATYQISAPHFDPRMGINADAFPTAGDRWARTHEDQLKKESQDG